MSVKEARNSVWSHYAQCKGKATRAEFWKGLWSVIGVPFIWALVVEAVVIMLDRAEITGMKTTYTIPAVLLVYYLIALCPMWSLGIRRYHDTGLTGTVFSVFMILAFFRIVDRLLFGKSLTYDFVNLIAMVFSIVNMCVLLTPSQNKFHIMSYIKGFKMLWSKYFDFTGKSRRDEFWWGYVTLAVIAAIYFACVKMMSFAFSLYHTSTLYIIAVVILIGLALLVPYLSLLSRRYHDVGISAWWIPFRYVVIVIAIASFPFMYLMSFSQPLIGMFVPRWMVLPPSMIRWILSSVALICAAGASFMNYLVKRWPSRQK